MGHVFFFLAVLAACLLWSATLTAAAARVHRFRWLLEALALLRDRGLSPSLKFAGSGSRSHLHAAERAGRGPHGEDVPPQLAVVTVRRLPSGAAGAATGCGAACGSTGAGAGGAGAACGACGSTG